MPAADRTIRGSPHNAAATATTTGGSAGRSLVSPVLPPAVTKRLTVATRVSSGKGLGRYPATWYSASRFGLTVVALVSTTGGPPIAVRAGPRIRSQPVSPGRFRSSSTSLGRTPALQRLDGSLGRVGLGNLEPCPRRWRVMIRLRLSSSSTRSTSVASLIGRSAPPRSRPPPRRRPSAARAARRRRRPCAARSGGSVRPG